MPAGSPEHPLTRALRAVGWPPEAILPLGEIGPFRAAALSDGAGGRPLVILSSARPILPERGRLLERHIDLNFPLAAALEAIRPLAKPGARVLAADPDRFRLLDLESEEALLDGSEPADWEGPLLQLLLDRESLSARLAELSRRDAAKVGWDLGRFASRVSRSLAAMSGRAEAEPEARRLAIGLLVSRVAWRRAPEPLSKAAAGLWGEAQSLFPLPEGGGADSAIRAAKLLRATREAFEALARFCPLRVWRDAADAKVWLARWCGLAAKESAPGFAALLGDFLLLSRAKLDPIALEFALLPESHQARSARAQLQEGLLPIRDVLRHSGAVVYAPLVLDARERGLGWALRHLEPLLDYWEAFANRQRQTARQAGAVAQEQDLFQALSPAAEESGLVFDPILAALGDSFRVSGLEDDLRSAAEALTAAIVWDWLRRVGPSGQPRQLQSGSLARLGEVFKKG